MPVVPMRETLTPLFLKEMNGVTWRISNKDTFEKQLKNPRMFAGSGHYIERSITYLDILLKHGLKENSKILDIGCGALNLGRVLIPLLNKGCYHGIEPNMWLLKYAFEEEIGKDIFYIKDPKFNDNSNFDLGVFGTKFNFIVAHSIFTHAPMSNIEKCLSEVKKVLESDGVFFFTFIMAEENCCAEYWTYPTVQAYTKETMEKTVQDSGLTFTLFPSYSVQDGQTLVKVTQKSEESE